MSPLVGALADEATLDRDVRLAVYRVFVETGRPPTPVEIARELGTTVAATESSLRRLGEARVLVLAPGTPYVWMANPFSAIPTPFQVLAGGRAYWANCIWDALGIPACLWADGRIDTSCPDCSEPLTLEIRRGALRTASDAVIHFSVPAANWWDDIGAT